MVRPRIEAIKALMKSKGFVIAVAPFIMNIVGVRAATSVPNSFDDWIVVFFNDDKGREITDYFPATTDPGTYWLQNPMKPEGTAIMCEGQYIGAYKVGRHRDYTAMEQVGPIDFVRDNDKDNELDFKAPLKERTIIKANIHRANQSDTSTIVDKWSAGCQVIRWGFSRFMAYCEKSKNYCNNLFNYTLLNERELKA